MKKKQKKKHKSRKDRQAKKALWAAVLSGDAKVQVPVWPAGTRDEIDRTGVFMQRDGSQPVSKGNFNRVIAECARMRGDLTEQAFVELCCRIADTHRARIRQPKAQQATAVPDNDNGGKAPLSEGDQEEGEVEEQRAEFLGRLRDLLVYWRRLPDDQLMGDDKLLARMDGVLFSTLVLIDGENDLSPFLLARAEDNEDVEVTNNISGGLHEEWGRYAEEAAKQIRGSPTRPDSQPPDPA